MADRVDLYNNVYADFGGDAETAVRRAAFGEDIGQSSWITADDWLGFPDRAGVDARSHVLEVGSGSGGPAVYLAAARGCRVTGVDINEHGVRNGTALATKRGLTDRVGFSTIDAAQPLPFPARVLRPGGRMLFTDAMVLTGLVSQEELATRSSIGFYLFVPPGENERLIGAAGFSLLAVDDVTSAAEAIAYRWHDARERYRVALIRREGEANFSGLQRFLQCVHHLSTERRLSRLCYLAERAA